MQPFHQLILHLMELDKWKDGGHLEIWYICLKFVFQWCAVCCQMCERVWNAVWKYTYKIIDFRSASTVHDFLVYIRFKILPKRPWWQHIFLRLLECTLYHVRLLEFTLYHVKVQVFHTIPCEVASIHTIPCEVANIHTIPCKVACVHTIPCEVAYTHTVPCEVEYSK